MLSGRSSLWKPHCTFSWDLPSCCSPSLSLPALSMWAGLAFCVRARLGPPPPPPPLQFLLTFRLFVRHPHPRSGSIRGTTWQFHDSGGSGLSLSFMPQVTASAMFDGRLRGRLSGGAPSAGLRWPICRVHTGTPREGPQRVRGADCCARGARTKHSHLHEVLLQQAVHPGLRDFRRTHLVGDVTAFYQDHLQLQGEMWRQVVAHRPGRVPARAGLPPRRGVGGAGCDGGS